MIDIFLSELLAEVGEQESKKIATASAGYAEDGPTFDPSGDYLCGTCIFRLMPAKCAIMKGKISMETGSCYAWYGGDQAYTEPLPSQLTQMQLGYTERPNVKGFGCKRCEYSTGHGYCNQWKMSIKPNACCYFNEGSDDVLAPGDRGSVSAAEEEEGEVLEELLADTLVEIEAQALFNGIKIEGFTSPEEEFIRAAVSRVPPELTTGVVKVIADRGMGAKHGNYQASTKEIRINPNNFRLRMRLGKGQGWMLHAETTMVHEIGHSVFEGLTDEQRNEWLALSGWVKSESDRDATFAERYIERRPGWPPYRSRWIHKKGVGFTRHYAEKNPDEDFADSFSFFILGKPMQMAPKKREFLEALVKEKVKRYPSALITGPTKAYVDASVEEFLEDLLAGGPGSGCNPAVAVPGCGRPAKDRSLHRGSITGLFVRGSDAHKLYEILKDGRTVKKKEIRALLGKQAINSTLAAMAKRVTERGWRLHIEGQKVTLLKIDKLKEPVEHEVKDFTQAVKLSPEEGKLASGEVKTSKPLGGGMNRTEVITFADGSKAVWKPDPPKDEIAPRQNITKGYDTEREAAAWQVARLVGMEDMVAPSVIREIKGERGVVLQWQEGRVAEAIWGDEAYDGKMGSARAAAFDYVIGNEDRHAGNWIVQGGIAKGSEGELKLIDHGLSFPDKGAYRPTKSAFINHNVTAFAEGEIPPPKEMAKPYVEAQDKIVKVLNDLGLPKTSADGVVARITKLKNVDSWRKLRGGNPW